MFVTSVEGSGDRWILKGPLGQQLSLARCDPATKQFEIGTIGTRCEGKFAHKTRRFAQLLDRLQRPIHLIDIRRSGAGGMGAWGPLELGSQVPRCLSHPYAFTHLPILAPSVELLESWRRAMKLPGLDAKGIDESLRLLRRNRSPDPASWRHWQVFRESYLLELQKNNAVAIARAFTENAQACEGGLAVFLCAEQLDPDFDSASGQRQDDVYCHRFTLAAAVARSLTRDFPQSRVCRIDLSLDHDEPLHCQHSSTEGVR